MRRTLVALAGIGTVIGAAGLASAAIPTKGIIDGCWNSATGQLRVIDADAGDMCRSTEHALQWNEEGPAGPEGPQGPKGDPGPPGPKGEDASSIFHASSAPVGPVYLEPNQSIEVARLQLPAGTYLVEGRGTVGQFGSDNRDGTAFCQFTRSDNGAPGDVSSPGAAPFRATNSEAFGYQSTVTTSRVMRADSEVTVQMFCSGTYAPNNAGRPSGIDRATLNMIVMTAHTITHLRGQDSTPRM